MRLKFLAVIVVAFAAGAALALVINPGLRDALFHHDAAPAGATRSTGEVQIGGAFSLTDHTGRRVTEKDFRGRYMLMFFGYTSCPDVCPTELQVMTAALEALGPAAERITPVFVTIDPARDTVERVASYVANFHPRMVGLTGTAEEIRAMAKTFRVYYAKAQGAAEGGGEGDDYLMDHSSIVYLMGPDGRFVAHFAYGTKPEAMAKRLRAILARAAS